MLEWVKHEWLLPFLRIGGSRNEFWSLTPKDLQIDFEAYNQRVKDQQQLAWLQGVYVKKAIESSVLICGLATKEVIRQMQPYPEMPFKEEVEQQLEEQNPQLTKEKKEIARKAIFNRLMKISRGK